MVRSRAITRPLTIRVTPRSNHALPSLLFSMTARSMSPTVSPSRVASPIGTL